MIGALLAFLVLFALVKVFERSREDLDNFNIATVAVVPLLSVVLVRVVLAFVYPNPTLALILPPIVLIGMTFFLLWKNLELPAARSALYTLAVVFVNEALGYVLAST